MLAEQQDLSQKQTSLRPYRCTRNAEYQNPDTKGHTELKFRRAYYKAATSVEDAIAQMAVEYPSEVGYGFTAELYDLL